MISPMIGIGQMLEFTETWTAKCKKCNTIQELPENHKCEECGDWLQISELAYMDTIGNCDKCGEKNVRVIFCPKCEKKYCLDKCIKIGDHFDIPEIKSIWSGSNWSCPHCNTVLRRWRIVHPSETERYQRTMNFSCKICGRGYADPYNSPNVCGICLDKGCTEEDLKDEIKHF